MDEQEGITRRRFIIIALSSSLFITACTTMARYTMQDRLQAIGIPARTMETDLIASDVYSDSLNLFPHIPAPAGIHVFFVFWIPAGAGMCGVWLASMMQIYRSRLYLTVPMAEPFGLRTIGVSNPSTAEHTAMTGFR